MLEFLRLGAHVGEAEVRPPEEGRLPGDRLGEVRVLRAGGGGIMLGRDRVAASNLDQERQSFWASELLGICGFAG